jgi:AcrR family transcriptional regulator
VVTQRRRERERQSLRQAILDAALEIAAQDGGWQAVTIRKVAERIEYSPPTIYEHFASKEVLLGELMRLGFQQLLDEVRAIRTATDDPRAALLNMTRAYWKFAFRSPELYQVMHGLGGVPFHADDESDKLQAAEAVFYEVVAALDDLVHKRNAHIPDLEDAAEIVWGTLHGLISLTMADCIDNTDDHAAHLAEHAVANMILGWCSSQP